MRETGGKRLVKGERNGVTLKDCGDPHGPMLGSASGRGGTCPTRAQDLGWGGGGSKLWPISEHINARPFFVQQIPRFAFSLICKPLEEQGHQISDFPKTFWHFVGLQKHFCSTSNYNKCNIACASMSNDFLFHLRLSLMVYHSRFMAQSRYTYQL